MERFGFIQINSASQGAIWIQAVSVGETVATKPLINQLRRDHPRIPLILSNTTLTGASRSALLYPKLLRIFFPLDFKHAVRRVLRRMRPRMLILMETELWPNLIAECARANIPVLLLNARLSARSVRKYVRFKPLIGEVLTQVSAIAAQNERSAKRFLALGVDPAKISVCGNLKFDMDISHSRQERARALRQQYSGKLIWVAGSTHAGEEDIILKAALKLWKTFPNMLLILAPRHPERFREVTALCATQVKEASSFNAGKQFDPSLKLLVLDEMGLLEDYLAAADVAFIGGSIIPSGGHNIFEAAIYSVPIVCGPHLFNFETSAKILLNSGSLVITHDADAMVTQLTHWLANESDRIRVGRAGANAAQTQRGALDKHITVVVSCLKNRPILREKMP